MRESIHALRCDFSCLQDTQSKRTRACSNISADPTTVTLAAHARRGLKSTRNEKFCLPSSQSFALSLSSLPLSLSSPPSLLPPPLPLLSPFSLPPSSLPPSLLHLLFRSTDTATWLTTHSTLCQRTRQTGHSPTSQFLTTPQAASSWPCGAPPNTPL